MNNSPFPRPVLRAKLKAGTGWGWGRVDDDDDYLHDDLQQLNPMTQISHIIDSVQCPRCNGNSRVFNSRDVDKARWRRRQCTSCGHRYSTYEIHAEEYERIQALSVGIAQLDSAIAVLQAIKVQSGDDTNGHR